MSPMSRGPDSGKLTALGGKAQAVAKRLFGVSGYDFDENLDWAEAVI